MRVDVSVRVMVDEKVVEMVACWVGSKVVDLVDLR